MAGPRHASARRGTAADGPAGRQRGLAGAPEGRFHTPPPLSHPRRQTNCAGTNRQVTVIRVGIHWGKQTPSTRAFGKGCEGHCSLSQPPARARRPTGRGPNACARPVRQQAHALSRPAGSEVGEAGRRLRGETVSANRRRLPGHSLRMLRRLVSSSCLAVSIEYIVLTGGPAHCVCLSRRRTLKGSEQ